MWKIYVSKGSGASISLSFITHRRKIHPLPPTHTNYPPLLSNTVHLPSSSPAALHSFFLLASLFALSSLSPTIVGLLPLPTRTTLSCHTAPSSGVPISQSAQSKQAVLHPRPARGTSGVLSESCILSKWVVEEGNFASLSLTLNTLPVGLVGILLFSFSDGGHLLPLVDWAVG